MSLPPVGLLVDIGSGLLFIALGLLVARVRPRARANLAFALFGVSFGLMLVTGNVLVEAGGALGGPLGGTFATAAFYLSLPAMAGLALVAAWFPGPWGQGEGRRLALAAGFGVAPAVPYLLSAYRTHIPGTLLGLGTGLELLQFAFYAALALLALRFRAASGPMAERDRRLCVLMTVALLCWPSLLLTVRFASRDIVATLEQALPFGPAYFVVNPVDPGAVFGFVGVCTLLGLGVLWLRNTRMGDPSARRVARNLALVVAAAPLVADGGLWVAYLFFETPGGNSGAYGAARIATVMVLAYAIVRHQLFGFEVKLKWTIKQSTVLGVFLVTYLAVAGVVQFVAGPAFASYLAVVLAGLLVFALAPLQRFAERVANAAVPTASPGPGAPRPADLDVYRAALEQALASGEGAVAPRDAPVLASLRAKLGISDREHAVLEHVVRGSSAGPGGLRLRLAPGEEVLGRYLVVRPLGEGAFSRTYLARDNVLRREVVLKTLRSERLGDPKHLEAFLREARILASLQHPNLVAVHDVERVGEEACLVMEYVDGGSLEERLRERGPLPLQEALRVADRVLAGLEAAHERGVVHRDVKPANILLTRRGEAKVGDFGAARRSPTEPGTQTGLTLAGGGRGTLATMSPEAARGGEVDARADLYAVGAVLYRMLAGRDYLDFAGRAEFDALQGIITEPPLLPLSEVREAVNAVLAKALAKDPGARFADAAEMRKALTGAA